MIEDQVKMRRSNREKCAEYRAQHRDEINRKRKEQYAADPERRQRQTQWMREWRRNNPEKAAEVIQRWSAKVLAARGFVPGLKEQRIEEQGGRCAICQVGFEGIPSQHIHADHCHATMTARGVLCRHCNRGIGLFSDDPERLRAAAKYLEKYRADQPD